MARGDKMRADYDEYLVDDNLHINWYPGHMKKTKELVRNNLKLVDVVVELLDARIPYSSKNPDIDKLAKDKPRVVILNKSDLADKAKLNKWINYYKERGIKAIPVDTMKGVGINKLIEECKNVTKEKMDALIEKGRKERPIRIMIVGVPNVGKSSIINKLTGRKSTVTGDKPGVTKGKQWVRLKGNLELLDTPGILWPKFEDQEVALNLAFSRAIKDEILDVETLALRLIENLMVIEPEKLKARYKLEELGETGLETMDMIGRKRGFITGRKELDYTRIAFTVLNEFRDGKIGQISLEVPEDIKNNN
jgi:ribosome biogenesis GTPase A